MVIAHIGGMPIEELLVPLASAGGSLVLAARLLLNRNRVPRR